MEVITFADIADAIETCGGQDGIAVSFVGNRDDYDEIRILFLIDEPDIMANFIRHSASGGFVYAGESGVVRSYIDNYVELAMTEIEHALQLEDGSIEEESEFEINGIRYCTRPSHAELIYGSEAWNAYEYGDDIG